MIGIIGSTGLIGNYLRNSTEFDFEFNSNNIQDIEHNNFDTVYISAPTSNRLTVGNNPTEDLNNIIQMIKHISAASIKKVVLIGTVDSIVRNHLPYGANRLYMENQLKQIFDDVYILRLSSLIHKNITKNILYDFKHNQYLDKINAESTLQWYDLNNLKNDITFSISNNLRERNLVSEPIFNKEIINEFFPIINVSGQQVTTQNIEPYGYTKLDIFNSIKKYLNE